MGSSSALALTLQLGMVDKKIKKLNQIWAKFKTTPASINLLLKDLTILISTVTAIAVDNGSHRDHPVIVMALNEFSNTLQHLQDLSGKYTSRFGRKPLTSDNLHELELSFTDSKIRLLLVQFLLERREATPSRAVVAEELAQLHVRSLSRVSLERRKSDTIEPKADSLLSFKCYSELIGREKILLQLDAEFKDSNIVALVGPGGIGKTQIAAEYAVRIQERQNNCHILWIDCESPTSLEASYRAVAETLQIQGWDDPRTDILEKTKKYLNQSYSTKWFMILQNVSRSSLEWESTNGLTTIDPSNFPLSLATYLPASSKGQILCISCEADVVQQLPRKCAALDIKALYDTEAALLFSSKLPKEMDTSTNILPLTEALGHIPLAICQAAAYMVATRCDAQRYLELLRSKKSFRATESCHKTAAISFSSIQKQNARAADLLSFMAVIYRRNVSKALLWHAWRYGLSDLMNQSNLPDLDLSDKAACPDMIADNDKAGYVEFSTALATLEAYLLVQYDARSETYSLHRIVQSAVSSILQQQDSISTWRSSAMVLLSACSHICRSAAKASPQVSLSNMVLHISEVVQEAPTGVCAGLAKAKILCDMAALKMSLTQPKASSPLLQEAYNIQKGLLKPQDPRLLRTLLSLAESTVYSESPAAAIPFFIQAIAGHKQTLGPGNRKTLFAQVNLCSNYVVIGDVDAASPVHYETQAAVSASLQISPDDRRRLQQRLGELKSLIALAQQRQGKLLKGHVRSASSDDLPSKNRLSVLRQDRKRVSVVRAFSSNSRVASLDSIVEMFEV